MTTGAIRNASSDAVTIPANRIRVNRMFFMIRSFVKKVMGREPLTREM
jgi:hypothetical protein